MEKNTPFSLLIILLIITGCSPVYYVPNSMNVPMLSKKDEIVGQFDYYYSSGFLEGGGGGEVQAAYAAGSHLGILFDAGGGSGGDPNNGGGGGYIEGGAGYFLPFGYEHRFIYETYGLLGYGWMNVSIQDQNNSSLNEPLKAGMTRIALQPSMGYKSRHFEVALGTRAGVLHYSSINGDFTYKNGPGDAPISQRQYLENNKNQLFIEPAITLRAGWPSVKGQLQIGYSGDLTNSNFYYNNGWVSLGLNFNIYSKGKK